jgi:hypothetical protein
MSLLANIKTAKLTGAVKVKLPPQTTKKTGGKWKILNTQAPLQNLMKRVSEYIAANSQGKKQRDTALDSMLSTLSSNKYNKMHKLLILGALSERKNIPFVNSFLQKFPENQIKNGTSALNLLRKTGKISENKMSAIPLPPPPKMPSPKRPPKMPSPKRPPKMPSPSPKANSTVFYTPRTSNKSNTMTALSTIKKLLDSQKSNEILKINLLIVGKKVKQLKYSRT